MPLGRAGQPGHDELIGFRPIGGGQGFAYLSNSE
jgi:hypothetical protein